LPEKRKRGKGMKGERARHGVDNFLFHQVRPLEYQKKINLYIFIL
jgi:hypothetical protein